MDVHVRNIRKAFGQFPALHDVGLDIESGELVALLGPSGSGKTTLLRVIAGLEQPDHGRILFGGLDASHRSVQERHVGFVFQHYALFRHMTVFENVAFGLRVRPAGTRPGSADIRERVLRLIDLVQLGGLDTRYPSQLSGGQRQRVALARALAIEPTVLLLDEPFGALDAKVRRELRRWLRELHDETGHTTIFVTHDQEEAVELADRLVIMRQGRIEQIGTPDDVYDEPATPFVFGFIGESSRLPVRGEGGFARFENHVLRLPDQSVADGEAELFVRPHDVSVGEPGQWTLPGIVRTIRRHGGTHRVEAAVGRDGHLVEADLRDDRTMEPGMTVHLAIGRARVFPFAVRQEARAAA
jgi:sulfate transport system ATP-binding protein